MRILTEPDMRRMEAAVRKVERMVAINQVRRQTVVGGGSGGGSGQWYPTDRVTIGNVATVTLTKATHEGKILWWDEDACSATQNVRFVLPEAADRAVGDSYYFATRPVGSYVAEWQPSRDTVIAMPCNYLPENLVGENDFIHGYWFNYVSPGTAGAWQRWGLRNTTLPSGFNMLSRLILTLTNKTIQEPVNGYWNEPTNSWIPTAWETKPIWSCRLSVGQMSMAEDFEVHDYPF